MLKVNDLYSFLAHTCSDNFL